MDKCIDKLKCSICNNHLSYFPIYLSLDKKNICGRCCESNTKTSPTPVYIRNEMYEIVAQFLKFPCRYHGEGCKEKLIPSEIPKHEKSCVFRVSQCPTEIITGCVEEVSNQDLVQHCQEKHSDLILKDYKFKIDLSYSYQTKNLLLHEDTFFVVTKNFCLEDNTFQCLVNNLEKENDSEIYSYQVNLSSNNRIFSIKRRVDDCKNKKICLDVLKDCDDDDCLIFCEIIIQSISDALSSVIIDWKNTFLNNNLLIKFKCSFCNKYLMPPFYKYSCDGREVCPDCRACYAPSLTDIATLLDYPCIYHRNGCSFKCKSTEMQNHKIFCSFADCECPINEYINCTWKGLSKDVMEHIKGDHHNIIVKCAQIFKFSDGFNCYIIKFSNRLFRLVFTKNGNKYIWSVQLIGHFAEKYKYEIEILNNDDSRKLQIRQPCATQPLIKKNQIGQNKNSDFSYFYDDQIQNLSAGQHFTFNVHNLT